MRKDYNTNIYKYVKKNRRSAVKFITMLGANFKRQFDLDTYKKFFEDLGYENVEYYVVEGRMLCAIAVITKKN